MFSLRNIALNCIVHKYLSKKRLNYSLTKENILRPLNLENKWTYKHETMPVPQACVFMPAAPIETKDTHIFKKRHPFQDKANHWWWQLSCLLNEHHFCHRNRISLVLLFSSLNGIQEAGGNLTTGCERADHTKLESKGKIKKNKPERERGRKSIALLEQLH